MVVGLSAVPTYLPGHLNKAAAAATSDDVIPRARHDGRPRQPMRTPLVGAESAPHVDTGPSQWTCC